MFFLLSTHYSNEQLLRGGDDSVWLRLNQMLTVACKVQEMTLDVALKTRKERPFFKKNSRFLPDPNSHAIATHLSAPVVQTCSEYTGDFLGPVM